MQKGNPAKLTAVIANFIVLLAVPMRFCQWTEDAETEAYYRQIEELFLIFAVPGCWFYLIFFAG